MLIMRQVTEKDKLENKIIRVIFNVIYIVLILGAIKFFFDKNSLNNNFGWLLLLAFWVFRGVHQMMLELWDSNKISAIINLSLAILALVCLIYSGSQQLFFFLNYNKTFIIDFLIKFLLF